MPRRADRKRRRFSTPRELINFFSLMGFLYESLDERLDLRAGLEKALRKPVPRYVNSWFCFGGITFLLFLLLLATGILLLFYYQPTTADAHASVLRITYEIPFGWLIRGVHHWGANLMVVAIFIHMSRVVYHGAYKPPRDFNWLVGVILLVTTLAFAFTGYLLPWSQLSYWATTVGTEIFTTLPIVGDPLKILIRGGPNITQNTLTRFFAVHVAVLPAVTILFLIFHFLMVRRQGVKRPL